MHRKIYFFGALVVLALAAATWVTDFVTLQGEWTIYTATCDGGSWNGDSCSGRLIPSARYRFRALKAHREILFWTAGDSGESGRYTQCDIQDGRNWVCPLKGNSTGAITHRMTQGNPERDHDDPPPAFRPIPKWRWELLSLMRKRAGTS